MERFSWGRKEEAIKWSLHNLHAYRTHTSLLFFSMQFPSTAQIAAPADVALDRWMAIESFINVGQTQIFQPHLTCADHIFTQ